MPIPQQTAETSEGGVDVPMLFSDSSARMLVYSVDLGAARELLAHTGLPPVEFTRGRAAATLNYYDYRRVGIGPYGEVALTLVVHRPDQPRPHLPWLHVLRKRAEDWGPIGAHVVDMPVTIPAALAAGKELWGFPKFVTPIEARLSGRNFAFTVLDPEGAGHIVRVEGRRGLGIPVKGADLVTYSNHRGSILRTQIPTGGHTTLSRARVRLEIGTSGHAMAQHLRTLRLDELEPFTLLSTDDFASRLPFGTPILPWSMPESA